ncbi:hypothetical protein DITRI_Ditri10aG0102500 [Diplodiscus trichospermus]
MEIVLTILAVVSPLYINQKPVSQLELEEQPMELALWLSLLLELLIILGVVHLFLSTAERSFTRFEPNWIHRVDGSSAGILLFLLVLAFCFEV